MSSDRRTKVLAAIASERAHQDRKWGTIDEHPHEVGAWILIAQATLDQAARAWQSRNGDYSALVELRKVAAVVFACLEQHGVPTRSPHEELREPRVR